MEIIRDNRNPQRQHKMNHFLIALAFIVVGALILLRNIGILNETIYHFVVSWKMLVVVIGVVYIARKKLIPGLVLIAVGAFFMTPARFGLASFWPLWLILIGIAILLRSKHPNKSSVCDHHSPYHTQGGEGFVSSDVTFGSAKHVVLEPCFQGAFLDVTFGGLVLDLRRTSLEHRETYIDMDATFSSVELFVPSSWNIVTELDSTLANFADKRFVPNEIDSGHKLILRGDVTFGSVEIKS